MGILQSLWMIMASASFAVMAAFIKLSALEGASHGAIIFARGLPSIFLILVWAIYQQKSFKTLYMKSHLHRSICGVLSMWCGFYAYAHLPLETATSLNYSTTLFITTWLVITTVTARNPIQCIAVLIGFSGVLFVLRPSVEDQQWFPILIGLMAGVMGTGAMLSVKNLGKVGEPVFRTVFYFSLSVTVSGLFGVIWADQYEQDIQTIGYLLGIGIFGLLGQIGLTRSFSYGSTVLTATLQYTTIIFSAVIAFFLWDHSLDWLSWLGMSLIVFSGALCAWGVAR
ncbi:DMT family transporter [Basilea psittacipulmonis]|nr:DMT family transporter [Basilea psittacipulmonis]